jgi:hypothetical protein
MKKQKNIVLALSIILLFFVYLKPLIAMTEENSTYEKSTQSIREDKYKKLPEKEKDKYLLELMTNSDSLELTLNIVFSNYNKTSQEVRNKVFSLATSIEGEHLIDNFLIKYFDILPEEDRNNLLSVYIMDKNASEVLMRDKFTLIPENLKKKFFTRIEEPHFNEVFTIIISTNFLKIDKKLRDKFVIRLVEKFPLIDNQQTEDRGALINLIMEHYSLVPQQGKEILNKIIDNGKHSRIYLLISFSNYFTKLPEKVRSDLFNKLMGKNNQFIDDTLFNIFFSNFQFFSPEQKTILKKKLEKSKPNQELILSIMNNYHKLPSFYQNWLFKTLDNEEYFSFISFFLNKVDKKEYENAFKIFDKYVRNKNYTNIALSVMETSFEKFPEKYRNNLIIELSRNKLLKKNIFKVLVSNYNFLPDNLKELLVQYSNDENLSRLVIDEIVSRYPYLSTEVKKLANKWLDKEEITMVLVHAITFAYSELSENDRDFLLEKLAEKKNLPEDLEDYFSEEDNIPEKFRMKLFPGEQHDLTTADLLDSYNNKNITPDQIKEFLLMNKESDIRVNSEILAKYFNILPEDLRNQLIEKYLKKPEASGLYLSWLIKEKFEILPPSLREKAIQELSFDQDGLGFIVEVYEKYFNKLDKKIRDKVSDSLIEKIKKIKLPDLKNETGESNFPYVFASISFGIEKSKTEFNAEIFESLTTGPDLDFEIFKILLINYENLSKIQRQEVEAFVENIALLINFANAYPLLKDLSIYNEKITEKIISTFDKGKKADYLSYSINPNFSKLPEKIKSSIITIVKRTENSDFFISRLINQYDQLDKSLQDLLFYFSGNNLTSVNVIDSLNIDTNYRKYQNKISNDIKYQLLKKALNNEKAISEIIWYMFFNYSKLPVDLLEKFTKITSEPKYKYFTASSLVFNYQEIPSGTTLNLLNFIAKDKELDLFSALTLNENFKDIPESSRNQILSNLLAGATDQEKVVISFILVKYYSLLPTQLNNELINLAGNKEYAKYVALALYNNFETTPEKPRTDLLNKLSLNESAKINLIPLLVEKYNLLSKENKNLIYAFSEDNSLKSEVLYNLIKNYAKLPEELKNHLLILGKDKELAWKIAELLFSDSNYELPGNVQNELWQNALKNPGLKIAFDKTGISDSQEMGNQFITEQKTLQNPYIFYEMIFYKNWDKTPDALKKYFQEKIDILFNPDYKNENFKTIKEIAIYLSTIYEDLPVDYRKALFKDLSGNSITDILAAPTIFKYINTIDQEIKNNFFSKSKNSFTLLFQKPELLDYLASDFKDKLFLETFLNLEKKEDINFPGSRRYTLYTNYYKDILKLK